jgi:GPI mannosyltransferase 3
MAYNLRLPALRRRLQMPPTRLRAARHFPETASAIAGWLWGPVAAAPSATDGARATLLAVLAATFVLRFTAGWLLPNIDHADEVYQVAEQANRVVNGFGIEPWEFRTASRAVILPTLVAPLYRLPVSAAAHRFLQTGLFCLLSLIPVWVAFVWVSQLHGPRFGALAGLMMGTWFELVHFAPKPTADIVCSYFLLLAVFLARPRGSRLAAFGAGASLVLAVVIRVQVAPVVLLAGAVSPIAVGRERLKAFAGGIAAGVAATGAVEWAWWGSPFQGQVGYLVMEATRHSSRYFAREPVTFYAKQYALMYGAALPVVFALIVAGARAAPVLLATAVAVILPFHFVGHKEYRFMVAGLPPLVLLMGLGASRLMVACDFEKRRFALPLAAVGWLVAMGTVSWGDTYRPLWTRHGNHVLAFEEVGRDATACGIALVGIRWAQTPGYSGLGRNVPIYEIRSEADAVRLYSAANYVLEATKLPAPPAPYVRWREYTRPVQYLYKRPGGCAPDPASAVVRPPGIPGID